LGNKNVQYENQLTWNDI